MHIVLFSIIQEVGKLTSFLPSLSACFTVNTPLQNRFFVFGGGYSKIFHWVVFEGGVFSRKFSEKTQNAAAPAAGFSSLCLQRKHFSKGRLSYVVLRHDSVTLAYPYIFLSFIMVYIHKMCKNIFHLGLYYLQGKKYITGVWGRSPQRKNGVYTR